MTIIYWVRFINDHPVAVMRTVQTEDTLEGEILRKHGWEKHSDALRFLQDDIDASEATREQAEQVARSMDLPFPD